MLKTLQPWIFWTEMRAGFGNDILCAGESRELPAGTPVRVLRVHAEAGKALCEAQSEETYTRQTARGTHTSNRRPVYGWLHIGQQIADPSAPRPCRKCGSTGRQVIGDMEFSCGCGGKTFEAPDVAAICAALVSTRGPNKGQLRKSAPDRSDARAYYVWRMARFHGGADVTLPFSAPLMLGGDPFVEELDQIADAVAKRAFGSDMAAAKAWGRALFGA